MTSGPQFLKIINLTCIVRWDNWAEHDYEEEEYEEGDLPQMVTAYPIPKLNEHGHVDMAELAFRDTLDEYFDIFVIILR